MLLAAVTDGKTVNFILHRRYKIENGTDWRNCDFAAVFCDGSGSVAVVFYHSEKRNIDSHSVKKFLNSRNVAFAAVQKDKVRFSSKGRPTPPLLKIMVETAFKHFAHAGIVVGSHNGFYGEFFIIASLRPCVFINHHSANHGFRTEVRNVVSFDDFRRFFHSEYSAKFVKNRNLLACSCLFVRKAFRRVVVSHIGYLLPFAFLRNGYVHLFPGFFGKPAFQKLRFLTFFVEGNFFRDIRSFGIKTLEKFRYKSRFRSEILEKIFVFVNKPSAAETENNSTAVFAAFCNCNNILFFNF